MSVAIDDQVVDFYGDLFDHLFSSAFQPRITNQRKYNIVARQIGAAADAASQCSPVSSPINISAARPSGRFWEVSYQYVI